jgi:hypothetical protein
MSRELWVWIRVPLHALERAIASLKESVMSKHQSASRSGSERMRAEADADEAAAEALKEASRKAHPAPPPSRRADPEPPDDTQ